MEHPDIERTMRTGYPAADPEVVTHCGYCGAELREKDEVVEYQGDYFCDKYHFLDCWTDSGVVKEVVLGRSAE